MQRPRLNLLRLGVAAMIAGLVGASVAAQESYLLGEQDELRLVAPEMPGLAGVYRLGEQGRIALPIANPPLLEGLTLEAAAAQVRKALEVEIVAPRVGLELATRRPFYITGEVAQPGAYAGRAGLTLGRALALAGGARRVLAGNRLDTALTDIRTREERDRARREEIETDLRLARIAAELGEHAKITPPKSLGGLPRNVAATMLARETEVLTQSAAVFAERIASIERLLVVRGAEISALEQRLGGAQRQTDQIAAEIGDTRKLLDSGLAPASRLNALLREADRQQSDILQISVLLNQARQAVAQLELDRSNLPRERLVALTLQAQEATARLAALRRNIGASLEILDETAGEEEPSEGGVRLVFHILGADGSVVGESDDLGVIVREGDLVTVRRQRDPAPLGQ